MEIMKLTQGSLQVLWLKGLIFLLFCYALFGKGFAYLFLGEFILVLGMMVFLLSRRILLVASDPVLLLWGIFAFWGLCRTVPFLGKYHFDAVRDAVLWGYGFFALLIAAFVGTSSQITSALNSYRKFLRWYLLALPLILILCTGFQDKIPIIPWSSNAGIIELKSADAAVHLAGAGLFLLIFPIRSRSRSRDVSIFSMVGFIGWSLSAFVVLIVSRGGFVAMALPIILVSVIHARRIGWKVAASAIAGIVFAVIVLESNLITFSHHGRTFTPDQIVENLSSIAGGGNAADLQDTKAWRLIWWHNIINYTIFGPYRWTGKGFGVNLAVEDGPSHVTRSEAALRSPHNGNMTVLARMGVPGIVIWAALNFTFAFRLILAYQRASRSGATFWRNVNMWILCYWIASFINMSFDVYLEGPQGGIWFWSIIGLGVAVLRIQKHETRQAIALKRWEASQAARQLAATA
jgi:hypothetical protein